MRISRIMFALAIALFVTRGFAQEAPAAGGYKLLKVAKVGGPGRWDYVYADSDGRRLYIPRTGSGGAAGRVTVYDLDTLAPVGEIPKTNGVHGVAIDPKSGHGFVSCKPVVMFDTKTLATIKTIDVDGNPDGILFDPGTEHIFVLSHRAPNVTVLNAADGAIVGTLDLGGAPEEGASDGTGRVFIDVEDKDNVAVVDSKAMKVIGHYDLAGKGGGPAGLAMDAKNHILFAFCHDPHTAVILNADDGSIITTLPIGNGVDAAEFNPNTMEAFSSQGDSTLTVIKENSPTSFEVEQNVQTKPGARTSALDSKTNQIFLITAEMAPATQPAPATQQAEGGPRRGRGRGQMVPNSFTILVVGK
jgi:DNA-binding beta-propeller fold protein YncE